jgi:hypothetical protein
LVVILLAFVCLDNTLLDLRALFQTTALLYHTAWTTLMLTLTGQDKQKHTPSVLLMVQVEVRNTDTIGELVGETILTVVVIT